MTETWEAHAPSEAEAEMVAMHSLQASGFDVARLYAGSPRMCRVTGHAWNCWAYTVHAEGEQISEAENRALWGDR